MLIKFSVKNYRSIKGRVEFNTCALSKRNRSVPNQSGFYSKHWRMRLLPVFAIFGPNSAGKTNVLSALSNFMTFIHRGSIADERFVRVTPFKLDKASQSEPICFEAQFLINDIKYRYSVEFQNSEVQSEVYGICATRTSEEYVVFDRKKDSKNGHQWNWGGRGKFALHQEHRAISNSIKPDRLFLTALGLTYSLPAITDFWKLVRTCPVAVDFASVDIHRGYSFNLAKRDAKYRTNLKRWLALFDIAVKDIRFENETVKFVRQASDLSVAFPISDESDGTRQLIVLFETILHGLMGGGLVMIDELDAHLHPFISRQIVSIFQSHEANPRNAQLFFTTHDTALMDLKLLRKEQIILVTQKNHATVAEPVSEYNLRHEMALARNYMDGRLSGLPKLGYAKEIFGEIRQMVSLNDESGN